MYTQLLKIHCIGTPYCSMYMNTGINDLLVKEQIPTIVELLSLSFCALPTQPGVNEGESEYMATNIHRLM